MPTYELMMITRGNLNEEAVTGSVDRFTKLIADQGGSVDNVDHWGKRQFAYEIKHMTDGYYTVIDFELDGARLGEVERQLRLADEVVRHKVVRPGPRRKKVS